MRIITNNDGDSGTLTVAPAAVASLPVTNLQDATRARIWRSTSAADQVLRLTWPTAKVLSALAILRHNLSASAQWRIQVFSDAAWSTQVLDTGTVPAYAVKTLGELSWGVDPLGASVFTDWAYAFSVAWFAPVTGQSVQVTLSDPTNPAGYLQASRLFAGNYFEPVLNADYELSIGWREATVQTRTEGGTLRSDPQEPYRALDIPLPMLSAAQGENVKLLEISRRAGLRKDFFISVYPGVGGALERDYTMAAKFVQTPALKAAFFSAYSTALQLEEA